jgi:hypothetical protein
MMVGSMIVSSGDQHLGLVTSMRLRPGGANRAIASDRG